MKEALIKSYQVRSRGTLVMHEAFNNFKGALSLPSSHNCQGSSQTAVAREGRKGCSVCVRVCRLKGLLFLM